MRRILALTLALILAQPILAQPTPIQPPVAKAPAAPIKAKVTPTAPKGSEQLCIDASAAKGKVTFKHDFPAGTFAVEGKKLFAALPAKADAAKKFSVWLTYWMEETQEELTVMVPALVGPGPPPDPESRDTLKQLRADMVAGFASLSNRVSALEAPRPPNPPIPPLPPVIDPFVTTLQASYNADGKPAAQLATLISVYKMSKPTVDDLNLKTIQDVFSRMHAVTTQLLGDNDKTPKILLTTRSTVKAAEDAVFGSKDRPLDAATRATIWAQHQKIQAALEALK